MYSNDYLYIVAKINNKIVGFIDGIFEGAGLFWLSWIGVDQDFRGNSIGTKLLKFLEKYLKNKTNVHKVWCCIEPQNAESISLFVKNKYINVAFLEKHWYGIDTYLWQKIITEKKVV